MLAHKTMDVKSIWSKTKEVYKKAEEQVKQKGTIVDDYIGKFENMCTGGRGTFDDLCGGQHIETIIKNKIVSKVKKGDK